MALGDGELDEVAFRIGDHVRVDDERVDVERLGHDLIRDQPDRACRAAFPGDREVGGRHRLEADGVTHPLGHLGRGHVVDASAALENELREERLEIGQEQEVADVPGRDGSVLREPVPERGMEGRHQDRVRRVDSSRDSVAHHAVHVAVVGDVLGVAVVGAERDPVRPVLAHERQQRLQVARHRRLADEEPDARAQALAPLLDRQHLVVRADARGGVRLQRLAEHAGRVPVDVLRSLERELRQLGVVTGDDAGEVHHLREAEHALAAHERLEVAELERPPRRLEGRGRDARGAP